MLKLIVGVTEDADRVQQYSKKMSKNVSFMILSATGITIVLVLVDGLFLLRGDGDGGDVWVSSGAGRISMDRDSFMEVGKDYLVKEGIVSGGSGK